MKKKGKRGKGRGKAKREGEREKRRGKGKKSQGGRDLEVDLFRAPKHSIILLKSKNMSLKTNIHP